MTTAEIQIRDPFIFPESKEGVYFPTYVTDGPFLFRSRNGILQMLWSSSGNNGCAMGVARSESGAVTGPSRQEAEPLRAEDGGHGMIFRGFDGRLFLTFHAPNNTPNERAVIVEVEDSDTGIQISEKAPKQ